MDATGVLLLGGLSRRFGSVKALAPLGSETLAERAWRVLGDAFPQRIAVGKDADQLGSSLRGARRRDRRARAARRSRGGPPGRADGDRGLPARGLSARHAGGAARARRSLLGRCGAAKRSAAGRLCAVGAAGARGPARSRRASTYTRRYRNWTRGPSSWTATCSRTSTPSASSTAYGRLLRLRSGSAAGWANA